MKKKTKIMLVCFFAILLLIVILFLLIKPRNGLKDYMGFEIFEDAELTFLKDTRRSVFLKFTIKEKDLSKFLKQIENADYYNVDISDETILPHPENNCKDWDMDYNKLDLYYEGNCTKGFFAPKRCSRHIFILKPENNSVTIYFCYYG